MRLVDVMLLVRQAHMHTHLCMCVCVCLCMGKSCPWLHSYAGPPSPTPSQECWRQLHTGSAKGKVQPGDAKNMRFMRDLRGR